MSHYDAHWVAGYFDELADGEWDRLVASPLEEIKLAVHSHHLKATLPAGARVLEVGAGAGRFTQVLAELGCRITVIDISPVQVALNEEKGRALGFGDAVEERHVMDILDLSAFADGAFDAVVCYGGPLSYVFDHRERALAECVRVLRENGHLLLSVMSLWGTIHVALPGVLNVPPERNAQIIRTGDLTAESLPGHGHYCHLFRAHELRELLVTAGCEVLTLSASNTLTTTWKEPLTEVRDDPARWAALVAMEIEACASPGCHDLGTHVIAVTRKTARTVHH